MALENLGEHIRTLRKERNLSQEALARRADVSLNLVGKLELGMVTNPHYATLAGLARALDVTVEELVEEPEVSTTRKASVPSSGPKEDEAAPPRFLTLNADFLRTICESMAGHYEDLAGRDVPPPRALGWWDVAPYDAGSVLGAVDVLLEGIQDGTIIDDEDELIGLLRAAYRLAHFADALWIKGVGALSEEIAAATLETQFWNLTRSLELSEDQQEAIVS